MKLQQPPDGGKGANSGSKKLEDKWLIPTPICLQKPLASQEAFSLAGATQRTWN
jgi:hypothetical protein